MSVAAPQPPTVEAPTVQAPGIIVSDPHAAFTLRAEREAAGLDRWDEVWNGVYIIMPLANNQHQRLATKISGRLMPLIDDAGLGETFAGCNVSDVDVRQPEADWRTNYRCPDVAIFLTGSAAEDRGSHWFGGPDVAMEIVSPGDRSRQKLGFYAAVGTRELFVLDRDPWGLELYRLAGGELESVGATAPGGDPLRTEAVPLRWSLTAGDSPAVAVSPAGPAAN